MQADINTKIAELIVQENEAAPFENLPEEERRLLRGLEDAIKNDDNSSVKFYLDELSTVISVRNVEHARSSKMNRWSVPLAVIGLAFTVIFGVVGMKGPNEEEFKNSVVSTIQSEFETINGPVQPIVKASAE